jgi:hypothetical protein
MRLPGLLSRASQVRILPGAPEILGYRQVRVRVLVDSPD